MEKSLAITYASKVGVLTQLVRMLMKDNSEITKEFVNKQLKDIDIKL